MPSPRARAWARCGRGRGAATPAWAPRSARYRTAADEARAVVAQIQAKGRKAVALQIDVAESGSFPAMKGGVEVFTRYMAKEFGARRISVNTIAPGAIETDFRGGAVRDNPEMNRAVAAQTALGRVGLPDDIGGAVALLLSPEAHWITGQRIEVSGGMVL